MMMISVEIKLITLRTNRDVTVSGTSIGLVILTQSMRAIKFMFCY